MVTQELFGQFSFCCMGSQCLYIHIYSTLVGMHCISTRGLCQHNYESSSGGLDSFTLARWWVEQGGWWEVS